MTVGRPMARMAAWWIGLARPCKARRVSLVPNEAQPRRDRECYKPWRWDPVSLFCQYPGSHPSFYEAVGKVDHPGRHQGADVVR